MFGKRAFSATVAAEHAEEFSLLDAQGDSVQHNGLSIVGKTDVFKVDHTVPITGSVAKNVRERVLPACGTPGGPCVREPSSHEGE